MDANSEIRRAYFSRRSEAMATDGSGADKPREGRECGRAAEGPDVVVEVLERRVMSASGSWWIGLAVGGRA